MLGHLKFFLVTHNTLWFFHIKRFLLLYRRGKRSPNPEDIEIRRIEAKPDKNSLSKLFDGVQISAASVGKFWNSMFLKSCFKEKNLIFTKVFHSKVKWDKSKQFAKSILINFFKGLWKLFNGFYHGLFMLSSYHSLIKV